jgi:hypothetical protein
MIRSVSLRKKNSFIQVLLSVNRILFIFCHIDKNYMHPSGQNPMTNPNMSYTQQQPTPIVNEEKPEPQLITFD